VLLESWSPTFLLFYEGQAELRRASQELVTVNGRLVGEYDFTSNRQLAFTFGRLDADEVELLGGLTLDILNMPPGAILHDRWGLALVPDGGRFPQDVAAFYPGSRLLRFAPAGPDEPDGTEYLFPMEP
jgi:hypothetical protein